MRVFRTVLFFGVWQSVSEEPFFYFAPLERNQRINIAFSGDGLVEDDGTNGKDDTDDKAPYVENSCEDQQDHTHEFQGISQFKTCLRVVSYGDESHVKHGFAVKPPGFNGIFSHDNTGDDTERSSQHTWGVDSSQPQTIDGKFQ